MNQPANPEKSENEKTQAKGDTLEPSSEEKAEDKNERMQGILEDFIWE